MILGDLYLEFQHSLVTIWFMILENIHVRNHAQKLGHHRMNAHHVNGMRVLLYLKC